MFNVCTMYTRTNDYNPLLVVCLGYERRPRWASNVTGVKWNFNRDLNPGPLARTSSLTTELLSLTSITGRHYKRIQIKGYMWIHFSWSWHNEVAVVNFLRKHDLHFKTESLLRKKNVWLISLFTFHLITKK